MNNSFTAIDFETATGYRTSICQVGIVRVENGIVKEQVSLLVQPPDNFYWENFTDIHGIAAADTKGSPKFNKVWKEIENFISNQNVVAHNGFGFDFQVLARTLEYYRIAVPKYNGHCTYKIYGNNLASLCREYNIALNHHDALSDALACAELYKMHLENK